MRSGFQLDRWQAVPAQDRARLAINADFLRPMLFVARQRYPGLAIDVPILPEVRAVAIGFQFERAGPSAMSLVGVVKQMRASGALISIEYPRHPGFQRVRDGIEREVSGDGTSEQRKCE